MTEHRKPRILVVEDHPQLADIVETRLRLDGMEPVLCRNGTTALDILATDPIDVVLLDIMMPVVDGYEVLRRIRANPATAEIPVIMLTAKVTRQDVEKSRAMGADDYIAKPFGPHDLVQKIRACLKKRSQALAASALR